MSKFYNLNSKLILTAEGVIGKTKKENTNKMVNSANVINHYIFVFFLYVFPITPSNSAARISLLF